jgi:hypothetical protein
MFVVGASYLSLLQAAIARCGLPYASISMVSELSRDRAPVYGIEIEAPCVGTIQPVLFRFHKDLRWR